MFAANAIVRGASRRVKFVGGANQVNTGTSVFLSGPAETLIGDLLIGMAASVNLNDDSWTPPAGFTELFDPSPPSVDTEAIYGTATHDGNWGYQATDSTSNNKSSAMVAFRGAAFDVGGSGITRSGTGTLVLPSVTLSKAGIIVALVSSANALGTHSLPAGMTLGEVRSGSGYPTVSIFYQRVRKGASGTRTVTIGGTPGNSAGLLVGIIKA